ncbi:MAG: ABC transporter ATP-binding protein [Solirubrobacteraceae bacterium]
MPIRSVVRRTAELLLPHRRSLVAVGAITIGNAGLAMVSPVLSRLLFDHVLFRRTGVDLTDLLLVLGGMGASILASAVLQLALTYLNTRVGQRVIHDLRERLYDRITRQSLRFFSGSRTGELQTRVLGDVGGIQSIVTQTWGVAVENLLIALGASIVMFVMSWPLALVSIAFLLPLPLVARHTSRVRRRIAGSSRATAIEMNVIAEQTLSVSGALLTKVFGRQSTQLERFRRESARLSHLSLRSEVLNQSLALGMQTFTRLAPFAMYLVAGIMLMGGRHGITVGTLVAFLGLQARLLSSLQVLADTGIQLTTSAVYFERIFEYLDVEAEIQDRPDAVALDPAEVRGSISFSDVWFSYADPGSSSAPGPDGGSKLGAGGRYWALREVTLEIEPGQMAAIVGPSGAGKTTLSYLVARLYEVGRGAVRIDGRDVRDVRLASLAGVIGLVTQETYVLNASVRENLLYAHPDASDKDIEAAARAALLHDRIIEFDDGYDSLLGDRGYRLSGGERQRLALARVFLKDAPILVLDEATSSLDSRNERLIQGTLARLTAGRTTVVIAHRLSTIMAADVIFVLDNGRVVEQGTHDELLSRGGRYAELYAYQFRHGTVEALTADGVVLAQDEVKT